MQKQYAEKSEKSQHLTPDEHTKLWGLFAPKSYSLCTTISQVLIGQQGRWRVHDNGVLCFVKDHVRKSFFLRLFNLMTNQVSWEMELYLEMEIKSPKPYFMTFDGDTHRIGLNFYKEEDCNRMNRIINEKVCRRNSMKPSRTAAPPLSNYYTDTLRKEPNNDLKCLGRTQNIPGGQMAIDAAKQTRDRGRRKKGGLSKADIGVPMADTFQIKDGYRLHQQSGQVDARPNPQEYLKNPAVQDLLERAGITEAHMRSDSAAQEQIYRFIDTMGIQKIENYHKKNSMRPDGLPAQKPKAPQPRQHQYNPPLPSHPVSQHGTLRKPPPPVPTNPPPRRPNKPPPPPPSGGRGPAPPVPRPSKPVVGARVPNSRPKEVAPVPSGVPAPPPPPPPPPMPGSGPMNGVVAPRAPVKPEIVQRPSSAEFSRSNTSSSVAPSSELLQAIQTGIKLNKVSERPEMGSKPSLHDSSEDIDMAEQLRKALTKYRETRASSGEDTSENDSDWDSD